MQNFSEKIDDEVRRRMRRPPYSDYIELCDRVKALCDRDPAFKRRYDQDMKDWYDGRKLF